jgi:hypothetical protein
LPVFRESLASFREHLAPCDLIGLPPRNYPQFILNLPSIYPNYPQFTLDLPSIYPQFTPTTLNLHINSSRSASHLHMCNPHIWPIEHIILYQLYLYGTMLTTPHRIVIIISCARYIFDLDTTMMNPSLHNPPLYSPVWAMYSPV